MKKKRKFIKTYVYMYEIEWLFIINYNSLIIMLKSQLTDVVNL